MSEAGFTNPFTLESEVSARVELEAVAEKLRSLIASQPPKELLGYLYSQLLLQSMAVSSDRDENVRPEGTAAGRPKLDIDESQFLLEYVHAVLATTAVVAGATLSEGTCAEIIEVAGELRKRCMLLAMMIAANSPDAQFGPNTRTLIFRALSNWILIRGNRHQVLEEEFFRFVLEVHDDALKRIYGIGATEIALGIQALSDSVRVGHMRAVSAISDLMENAEQFMTEHGTTLDQGADDWKAERPEMVAAAQAAYADLFYGGICCVSRHASLPEALLSDLSYAPGEECDFFEPGPYSGTPFRSLPARKKPLIRLDGEYFLTDPSFARDAAYRGILYNLLCREPGYKTEFNARQKAMSEAAFERVFSSQLQGARVLNEVYYKHQGNWFENDTLVLIDDVLILAEAKSGAAATIASPASDFDRHARDVRDLIVKAHEQCRRFLEYLDSADEVPLYRFKDGRYEEVARVRLSDYRLVLPIGLTVESYSPFSTGSKELPGVDPILGRFPFISISIDELLVLTRFLPTTGELIHYFQIRQEVAGLKQSFLFDEMDHLGAYISKNRFCDDIRSELSNGKDWLVVDGMCDVVDEYFSRPDWERSAPPAQSFPDEIRNLLAALDATREPGWLEIDSRLRDYGSEGRNEVAAALQPLRESLRVHQHRYVGFQVPLGLFWLHRQSNAPDLELAKHKAELAAIVGAGDRVLVVVAAVDSRGNYGRVSRFWVERPQDVGSELLAEAEAMRKRSVEQNRPRSGIEPASKRKQGRNDPCSCGSGKKFKKCHGR